MSLKKMRFSRRRRGGRRQAARRRPVTRRNLRKVDNTIAFRAKIDGFCIEKRRLEPFLELNSVEFHA